jgi:hypothetical protein
MNQSFETTSQPLNSNNYSNSSFSSNTVIAILLGIILIVLIFGVNLLSLLGGSLDKLIDYMKPLLSFMVYTTTYGTEATGDVLTGAVKSGADVAGGVSTATSKQIRDVSGKNINEDTKKQLDTTFQGSSATNEPSDDKSETPIQKPITSDKTSWCLIGEYQGKRGCIDIKDASKCMSGQVFPNEKMCLNPTQTA